MSAHLALMDYIMSSCATFEAVESKTDGSEIPTLAPNLPELETKHSPIVLSPCTVEIENISLAPLPHSVQNASCDSDAKSSKFHSKAVRMSNKKRKAPTTSEDEFEVLRKSTEKKPAAILEPLTPQTPMEFSIELKKVLNERNILTSKTRKRVFDALDEIKTKSEEESRHFKREKALLEIINSEIKYVHQLEIIINFFMKPTQDRKLLKEDDFQILFGNINTIYSINKELLEELDKGSENVTNAFFRVAPFLKLYSVYAYKFKNILYILQNARTLNPQFSKFVEDQESRPEVQSKLSALLITPIQRVPRYKLLLTQLHQLTKPSEKDFDALSVCLEKIEDAAEHINKIVEDQENMQRLLELQRYLKSGEPTIIKPGRKLIKEGILIKMATKTSPSEKLYTVLMNDIIMFNKMKKDELKVNSLKCLGIFPLSKCQVIAVPDKGCMRIISLDEEHILYHNQVSETNKWIEKIKNAVQNHLEDRKTLRKDSSSRRPVKRKDMYEYHEAGLSPGRPLKKRRLEPESNQKPAYILSRRRPINTITLGSVTKEDNMNRSVLESSEKESTLGLVINKDNINKVEITSTLSSTLDKPAENSQPSETTKEVYVFGKPNHDLGFRFGKFLGGVGSTIKRFLGFRN